MCLKGTQLAWVDTVSMPSALQRPLPNLATHSKPCLIWVLEGLAQQVSIEVACWHAIHCERRGASACGHESHHSIIYDCREMEPRVAPRLEGNGGFSNCPCTAHQCKPVCESQANAAIKLEVEPISNHMCDVHQPDSLAITSESDSELLETLAWGEIPMGAETRAQASERDAQCLQLAEQARAPM